MAAQLPNIKPMSSAVSPEVRGGLDSIRAWIAALAKEGGIASGRDLQSLVSQVGSVGASVAGITGGIPPAVAGFTATGAFATVILTWDDPNYTAFSYAEVWRASTDNLGTAVRIGTTSSTMYTDAPSNSSSSVDYYYWVRLVNVSGQKGPYNATAGTLGSTANDPAYVMELLLGKLGYDQFDAASGVFPIRTETALPALPAAKYPLGVLVYLTTDGKLYRNKDGAWTAAVAASDMTGQIVAAQVADAAISTAKFAAGIEPVAIVSSLPAAAGYAGPKAVLNSTDGKIYRYASGAWTAAVPTVDLTGTVSDAQIAALAASKVTGQLTDAQIAAVAAAKLTGQITAVQITDGAVTDAKIAALAASKVTGQLTDAQIAAVAAAKVSGQIVGTQISNGAISTAKLAAGAVTANEIAADTITAAQIAAGAISATELAASAVTAGKIAAGSVQAGDIAAGAIVSEKIAAGAVTAATIAAGAVTAGKVAADAITANEIAAGAISATELAAGAVTAGKIAAGSVTTSNMVVTGAGASLIPDSGTVDASAWSAGSIVADTTSPTGSTLTTAINTAVFSSRLTIDKTKNYLLRMAVKQVSGTSTAYLAVAFYDANNNLLTGSATQGAWPGVGTYHYWGLVGVTMPTSWTEYSISFGPNETSQIPAAAVFVKIGWLANYAGGAGEQRITNVRLMEKATGSLIVDGSITAVKVAANAITSDKIAANSIVAGKIAAGAVSATEIAAGAITTAKLAAGAVTANELAANSVSAGKIVAGAVDANAIAANSVIAGKIATGAIVAGDGVISNAAIGTAHIIDGTMTTAKIANLAVDAAKIANAAIVEAKIADAAITNAKIGNYIQSTSYVPGVSGWTINKNGTVEFNGGTFRGSVTFTGSSSGYANLTDKPTSLSSISSTEADKLSGIEAGATVGATGAQVTTLNAAYSNSVTALDITDNWVKPGYTLIDGNKIYTGDAYVDTLQIKGEAVNFVRYVSNASMIYGDISPPTVCSKYLTGINPGHSVLVTFAGAAMATGKANGSNYSHVKVYRDAVLVWTSASINSSPDNASGDMFGAISFMFADIPTLTSHTYTVKFIGADNAYIDKSAMTLLVIKQTGV